MKNKFVQFEIFEKLSGKLSKLNITKINIDTDSRLAFTASIRETLAKHPDVINPREYLAKAVDSIAQNCTDEILNIMGSCNKV